MKTCRKCVLEKPIDDFYSMVGMRDGHRNDCKACNLAAKAARYKKDPQRTKARVRKWQAENPDRVLEWRRRYAASGKKGATRRRYHLKRNYNLTPEQYDEMLATQGGGCGICGRPPRSDISLHVG